MYYAYVLKSDGREMFYKGACMDIDKRLKEHNAGKTKSTRHGRPWTVVYFETFDTFSEALQREKYFKTAAGRRYLKSILIDTKNLRP